MARRSARLQSLPEKEVLFLATLKDRNLQVRCSALYHAGWTLAAIGQSLTPPRQRSTIKSWVDRHPSPDPRDLTDVDVPIPRLRTPEGGYQRLTPKSPGVPLTAALRLQELAPLARAYRHRMPSSHPSAQANQEMNEIVLDLRNNNVSIADIARAAQVTHRAIARRLEGLTT